MTLDDAAHYTDKQRADIIAQYPEHMRDIRAKGIPSFGAGLIFPIDEKSISGRTVHASDTLAQNWRPRFWMDAQVRRLRVMARPRPGHRLSSQDLGRARANTTRPLPSSTELEAHLGVARMTDEARHLQARAFR